MKRIIWSWLLVALVTRFLSVGAADGMRKQPSDWQGRRSLQQQEDGKGTPVYKGQYPFLASIRGPQGIRIGNLDASNKHLCVGVLIAPKVVLCAAHCVAAPVMKTAHVHLNRYIREGEDETPLARFDVQEVRIHPSYGSQTKFNFDVALLSLKTATSITPVPLPTQEGCSPGKNCNNAVVIGWGLSHNIHHEFLRDPLKSYKTTLVSRDQCRQQYGKDSYGTQLVTDSMLCAGKGTSESCVVESGGPLLVDGELKGLLSWGASCGSGKPDVFSNLAYVRNWIQGELDFLSSDGKFSGRSEVLDAAPKEASQHSCIFANGRWLPDGCRG